MIEKLKILLHKKTTQLWIAIVILLMLAYTVCCFFIIDRYAVLDSPEALPTDNPLSSMSPEPPEISITVDNTELDYILTKTYWEGEQQSLSDEDILDQIQKDDIAVPTIYIGDLGDMQERTVTIDFKDHILPDTIHLCDILLFSNRNMAKDTSFTEQLIQTVDDHQIAVPLMHHISVMVSSNSHDYEKSYQRLFRLSCTWGENTCEYIFMVETSGKALTSNVNLELLPQEDLKYDTRINI